MSIQLFYADNLKKWFVLIEMEIFFRSEKGASMRNMCLR